MDRFVERSILGDEADAAGLVGAEEDVGDELGHGGGGEVDGRLVVPGGLVADGLGDVDLEKLDTTELEPALNGKKQNRGQAPTS